MRWCKQDWVVCPAPCWALQDPEPAAPQQLRPRSKAQGYKSSVVRHVNFACGSTFIHICTLVVPALALSTLPLIPLAT